jgi:hypothetical protein
MLPGQTCSGGWYGVAVLTFYGAAIGALVGVGLALIGGFVAGAVGILVGRAWGWSVAGALGAIALEAAVYGATHVPFRDAVHPVSLMPVAIGAALGGAIGRAVRTGKSRLPAVMWLAQIIMETLPGAGERLGGRGNGASPSA